MREIKVPRLNANDDSCRLLSWRCSDGDRIASGAVIAELETSKANSELTAEGEGVFHAACSAGREVAVGAVIGWLFASEDDRRQFLSRPAPAAAPPVEGMVVTEAARRLAEQRGIALEQLRALGKPVVRESDVVALVGAAAPTAIAPPPPSTASEVDRVQQAVARSVIRAHAEIPPAYVAVRVWCDAALAALKARKERREGYAHLPELLVKAVGLSATGHALCFGGSTDPDVGVTLDAGAGLFIPVVRRAASRSVTDIAADLLDFRKRATAGSFDAMQLAGAHVSISLNFETDCVAVIPLIVPGQRCMVVLTGLQSLAVPQGGSFVAKSCVDLGLAYDHRAINGAGALQLLKTVKRLLEAPTWLQENAPQ